MVDKEFAAMVTRKVLEADDNDAALSLDVSFSVEQAHDIVDLQLILWENFGIRSTMTLNHPSDTVELPGKFKAFI